MADPQIDVLALASVSSSLASACAEIQSLSAQATPNLADLKAAGERLKNAANALRNMFEPFESGNRPVRTYFNKIGDEGENLKGADDLQTASAVMKRILLLVGLKPTDGETANELQSLFRNISTSLISAQKELNRSSLEYATSLDPRLPQTLYGIPSVKAEMRVGFNKIEGKGINLFFFTSSKQKQEFAESVVSFEVAATPPPPGPITYGDYVVPIPRLIVLDETRAALLDEILKQELVKGATYTNTRDKAVVLRYESQLDSNLNRYLVIWHGQATGAKTWSSMSLIYAIGRVTTGGDTEFFEFPVAKKDTIFEFPQKQPVLVIPPGTDDTLAAAVDKLFDEGTPTTKLAKLSIDLGDLAMNISEIVNAWLESVKYKPPQ